MSNIALSHTYQPAHPNMTTFALSPDGRLVACASTIYSDYQTPPATVELWDLSTHQHQILSSVQGTDYSSSHRLQVSYLAWTYDSTHLVLGRDNGVLEVWRVSWTDTESSSLIFSHTTNDILLALACGSTRLRFIAATRDQLLYWEPGRELAAQDYPPDEEGRSLHYRDQVRALAFSPDDSQLITGHEGGELMLWDAADTPRLCTWWRFSSDIQHLRLLWSPDSQRIVANGHWGDDGGFVHREDTTIKYIRTHHTLQLSTYAMRIDDLIAWSPDGTYFITLRFDSALEEKVFIELWHSLTGEPYGSYEISSRIIQQLVYGDLNALQGIISPEGTDLIWCAQVTPHYGEEHEIQGSLWYGKLPLPPHPNGKPRATISSVHD